MKHKILLLGASTGGPSQIKEILSEITSLSSTVIIVQHMKEEVLPLYIKDLSESTRVEIQTTPLVIDFSKPSVIVCSGSSSLIKNSDGVFEIVSDKENQNYTPDINKFFKSFEIYANEFDISIVIMTGIGRDGVDGAITLKQKGARVVAQDEDSCAVYGMPKAAQESGIVDSVKTLDEIKKCFRNL